MNTKSLEAIAHILLAEKGFDPKCYSGYHPCSSENALWEEWLKVGSVTLGLHTYILFWIQFEDATAAWFAKQPE